jgi:hypothetical protein
MIRLTFTEHKIGLINFKIYNSYIINTDVDQYLDTRFICKLRVKKLLLKKCLKSTSFDIKVFV